MFETFLMAFFHGFRKWSQRVINFPVDFTQLSHEAVASLFKQLKAQLPSQTFPAVFINWNPVSGSLYVIKPTGEFTNKELKGLFGTLDVDLIDQVDGVYFYTLPQLKIASYQAYDVFGQWIGANFERLSQMKVGEQFVAPAIPSFNQIGMKVQEVLRAPFSSQIPTDSSRSQVAHESEKALVS